MTDTKTLEVATRAVAWEMYPRPRAATQDTILDHLPQHMVLFAFYIARAALKAIGA